jgi:hypothetical protein
VTIHVPGEDLGREGTVEAVEESAAEVSPVEPVEGEAAEEAPKPKKKTRRGSRGGRNRKKKPAAVTTNGVEAPSEPEAAPEDEQQPESANGDFEYVPMSEWLDEIESKG